MHLSKKYIIKTRYLIQFEFGLKNGSMINIYWNYYKNEEYHEKAYD